MANTDQRKGQRAAAAAPLRSHPASPPPSSPPRGPDRPRSVCFQPAPLTADLARSQVEERPATSKSGQPSGAALRQARLRAVADRPGFKGADVHREEEEELPRLELRRRQMQSYHRNKHPKRIHVRDQDGVTLATVKGVRNGTDIDHLEEEKGKSSGHCKCPLTWWVCESSDFAA